LATSPAVFGGGFSPDDSTFFSVVVSVFPPGVDIVSVYLTFVSSPQPTRPNAETEPRIKAVLRRRFMGQNPLARVIEQRP